MKMNFFKLLIQNINNVKDVQDARCNETCIASTFLKYVFVSNLNRVIANTKVKILQDKQTCLMRI